MLLVLALSDVFVWLDSCHTFLAESPDRGFCVLRMCHLEVHDTHLLSLVRLILITWSRCCLMSQPCNYWFCPCNEWTVYWKLLEIIRHHILVKITPDLPSTDDFHLTQYSHYWLKNDDFQTPASLPYLLVGTQHCTTSKNLLSSTCYWICHLLRDLLSVQDHSSYYFNGLFLITTLNYSGAQLVPDEAVGAPSS